MTTLPPSTARRQTSLPWSKYVPTKGSAFGGERANETFGAFPEHCGTVDVQRSGRSVGENHVAGAQERQIQATREVGWESEVTGEARVDDGLDLGRVPTEAHNREGYDGLSPGATVPVIATGIRTGERRWGIPSGGRRCGPRGGPARRWVGRTAAHRAGA